jgi:CRP-like cAMP-binding protein
MPCATCSADILRALPLFSTFTDSELAQLLPSIRRRAYTARASVLRADVPPDGLYIILSGRVRLVHHDAEGRALIAESFGPGELFGEMGLIDASPCPASVIAAEDCSIVFVPREAMLECLSRSRTAVTSLLKTSLERLCKAHRQMANLALMKVYSRVAQVLAANGEEADGEWHVNVGAEQIAAMVGASREMVSRVVRCMIEKRLVRRFKRKLIVIDRDALLLAQDRKHKATREAKHNSQASEQTHARPMQ